jgi:hypothetical protein
MVALMVTLPNGLTLPVAFAEIVPTGWTNAVKLQFAREMAVVF